MVVENMPGAGSVLLSNRIYNIAPKDGTFLGLVQRGVLISQLTSQNGVHYDLSKFNWIGNVSTEISLITAWKNSPINSIQDVFKREMVVGGTGATADSEASARILNGLAGAKFKIVSGYPGTADVVLAMQRGELEGLADLSWSEIKSKNATMLATHDFKFLAQNALEKSPELPDIPLSMDFVTNPADKPVAELYYAMKSVARPILSAPGIPAERVEALRAAFDKMVLDEDFQNDWRSAKLDLNPTNYKSIDAFISRATSASPDVRARLTEILSPKR
jgi:tripartite-type tricarboxylate transporter receptor subunit TctC